MRPSVSSASARRFTRSPLSSWPAFCTASCSVALAGEAGWGSRAGWRWCQCSRCQRRYNQKQASARAPPQCLPPCPLPAQTHRNVSASVHALQAAHQRLEIGRRGGRGALRARRHGAGRQGQRLRRFSAGSGLWSRRQAGAALACRQTHLPTPSHPTSAPPSPSHSKLTSSTRTSFENWTTATRARLAPAGPPPAPPAPPAPLAQPSPPGLAGKRAARRATAVAMNPVIT